MDFFDLTLYAEPCQIFATNYVAKVHALTRVRYFLTKYVGCLARCDGEALSQGL